MTIPLIISAVSLVLSVTVAWLTLLRRGTLGMTQPMLIGFLHEAEQPKIFFRAMLYATGKRGHIVEALYLKVKRGESTQTFNFWMYGETKDLKIGSGLRVGEEGVSFNHHFLPPRDVSSFAFLAGEYTIEAYARILNRHAPVPLSTVKLSLSVKLAAALLDRVKGVLFTWVQTRASTTATCRSLRPRRDVPDHFRAQGTANFRGPELRILIGSRPDPSIAAAPWQSRQSGPRRVAVAID